MDQHPRRLGRDAADGGHALALLPEVDAVAGAEGPVAVPRSRSPRAPSGTVLCSSDGRIVAVEESFSSSLGQPSCELLGASLDVVFTPDTRPVLERLLEAAGSGTSAGTAVGRLRSRTGQHPVELRWRRLAALAGTGPVLQLDVRGAGPGGRRAVLDRLASEVVVVSDELGRLTHVSPAVEPQLGHAVDDLLVCRIWDFVHPDDLDEARATFGEVLVSRGQRTSTLRVRTADGRWRWVEQSSSNQLDGPVGGIVSTLLDVTDRVAAQHALQRSEARYRAIAETAEEGIWALGLELETLYSNGRAACLLGTPPGSVPTFAELERRDGATGATLRERLARTASAGPQRFEVVYRHPDLSERHLWVSASALHDDDGLHVGSLAMITDISGGRRAEQRLRDMTVRDPLTGLPNRALLLDRLEGALGRAVAGTAVLFVDLDGFRLVNDSLGREAGDALLRAVADRLRGAVAEQDTVGRLGADEFVVVRADAGAAEAQELASRITRALTEPVELDDGPVHLSATIGIAVTRTGSESASDLLRHADTAVHAAKTDGRGRVRLFDAALAEDVEHRYALASDLRAALARDELELHYQPVVDTSDGRVVGMEALARWTDPRRGSVPPATFVRIAELAGLAHDLDRWVLRRALRDAAVLRTSGAVPREAYVGVNLSALSLADDVFEADLCRWTEEAGLQPADLVLEITETAIMQDATVAVGLLDRLREHGFGIAIDDFGTGYSSLAYLRDLPITMLKIDRSFIAGIAKHSDALAIVASIVELAAAVGVCVVAEGVELPEQAVVLQRLGCGRAQGWLWSRAVPPSQVLADGGWRSPLQAPSAVRPCPPPV